MMDLLLAIAFISFISVGYSVTWYEKNRYKKYAFGYRNWLNKFISSSEQRIITYTQFISFIGTISLGVYLIINNWKLLVISAILLFIPIIGDLVMSLASLIIGMPLSLLFLLVGKINKNKFVLKTPEVFAKDITDKIYTQYQAARIFGDKSKNMDMYRSVLESCGHDPLQIEAIFTCAVYNILDKTKKPEPKLVDIVLWASVLEYELKSKKKLEAYQIALMLGEIMKVIPNDA